MITENKSVSIKVHPDQVLSAVKALEQIALKMSSVNGFLNHFFMLIVPHGVIQNFFKHIQRPQFTGSHITQIGAIVTTMGAPVFLLPTRIARSAVDKLIQLLWIVHTIIQRTIILKAAVVFPSSLTAGNALWAQILNIFHGIEGVGIVNMSILATAITNHTLLRLLKSPGIQRVWMIPERRETKFVPLFLLSLETVFGVQYIALGIRS